MEDKKKELEVKAPAPSAFQSKVKKPQRVKPNHPKYSEMVLEALRELKKYRGASRQAISSYITTKFPVGSSSNRHLSVALKTMVDKKALVRTKGVGAAGSFKINKEAPKGKQGASRAKKGKGRKVARKPAKRGRPLKKRAGAKKRKTPVRKRKAAKSAKRKPVKRVTKAKAKKTKAKRKL